MALLHVPDEVKTKLSGALAKCRVQSLGDKDLGFIFLFAKSRVGLELELLPAAKALAPAGMLWISWPRRVQASPPTSPKMWFGGAGLMLDWWM